MTFIRKRYPKSNKGSIMGATRKFSVGRQSDFQMERQMIRLQTYIQLVKNISSDKQIFLIFITNNSYILSLSSVLNFILNPEKWMLICCLSPAARRRI